MKMRKEGVKKEKLRNNEERRKIKLVGRNR
jgi:hypothetical protein